MVVSRRTLGHYAGALVAVAVATLVRHSLHPVLHDRAALITFVFATSFAAWLGGLGPGLLSLVLGGLVASYAFMHPGGTFLPDRPEALIGLWLYYATGLIIVLMAHSQRSARRRAEAGAKEAIERQAQLEAEIARRERVEREREQLLAEQARLRVVAEEQSATLGSILAHAPIAIAFHDTQLRHVLANEQSAGLFGLTPDRVVGRTIRELVEGRLSAARIDEVEGLFRRVLETGQPFSIRAWASVVPGPGGQVRSYDWDIRRVERAEGGTLGLLVTAVDVTEAIDRERALREADGRKNEFLAVLAHEIRNPLASIRNSLRIMRRSEVAGVPADSEPDQETAERQLTHLTRLVDDLMDVSRITRGRVELRKQRVELARVLDRAIEALRPTIDRRGHVLTVDLPPGALRLEADPTRLEQVLGNLLSNAAKYTPPGGSISVRAREEAGEAVLTVRDSGLGISAEILPKVFEMFVQDGDHAGHAQGGLGIGLGLARSFIELHGGRILARSDGPGTGSEFEVRLPLIAGETRPESNGSTPDGRGGLDFASRRRRILVVDDNEDVARSLVRLLERVYRQEVRVAYDGPSALDLAEAFRPDLIFLDIGMPGMDGCEVARQLRLRSEFARTPLVALTGWGQDADRRRSEEAGIDRHLVKPVDPDVLGDLIATAGA